MSVAPEDGSPGWIPVRCRWGGAAVRIWTGPAFPWARRLAADPRVAFAVFDHAPPRWAVYVRGRAEIQVGSFAELRDEAQTIGARYIPAADVDRAVDEHGPGPPKAHISIVPSSLRALVNSG